MAKFLIQGSYTAAGAKGLIKDGGTKRQKEVEAALRPLGGTVESFYFCFGTPDVFLVVDFPDSVTAAAVSLVVNASGAVQLTSTPLITPEELDQAAQKSVDYHPPGQ